MYKYKRLLDNLIQYNHLATSKCSLNETFICSKYHEAIIKNNLENNRIFSSGNYYYFVCETIEYMNTLSVITKVFDFSSMKLMMFPKNGYTEESFKSQRELFNNYLFPFAISKL